MTAAQEHRATEVGLDDLRRRLYRADATDADLQRYLAEQAVEVPEDEPRPVRRRVAPRSALVVAAGVVAALVVAIGVLPHRSTVAPTPAAPRSVAVNVGDGRIVAGAPGGFTGPTRTAVTIDGTSTAAQRFDGVGDQFVPVQLPGAEFVLRRAVVVLYSAHTSTIAWRALRVAARWDWSSYWQVVTTGRVASHLDDATPSTFSYAGAPPSRFAVEAPPTLHWTLLIAVASDPTPLPH